MNKLFVLIFALFVSGCSTSAVPLNKAREVPPERAMNYQYYKDGYSKLTVIRDSGNVGSACYAAVFVNGKKSALLEPSEKTTLNLPSGEYLIGTSLDGAGWCSMGNERQERQVSLSNGRATVVRIFSDASGNMDIKPSSL